MNDNAARFTLSSRDANAPAPVLAGVEVQGRLDAVLFELTLRQTYRNVSDRVLEVVYTFPLPPMAVLLGFASELNGQRQQGAVVARREAEQRYEKSLEEGDAPVMLEAHGDGLHTANIGNLKPGEEVVLEARFAQWLSFEQGRLRVSIPTAIAPRFGSAEQAGLQPQQVPQASLDAEYPLRLALTVGEALAGAVVECPTHRFMLAAAEEGKSGQAAPKGQRRFELAPGAWLDRDVVVLVTPREPRPSLVVQARDAFDAAAPVVVLAALQPPPGAPRESIALKLLVDCSGSMGGDSIVSARAALRGVVAGLSERDRLSLSRFGSSVQHLFAPADASAHLLRRLQPLIDGLQADLGGTEMQAALEAVFALPVRDKATGSDVLLITDGEIWQADEMVAAARRSGHRVFAIGVGSAPAEGVLRSLAEATGGACEFATPGEALEKAAQRMLQRMRQPAYGNVRVDWGSAPVWECGPAASVFGGDTVIALAGFVQAPNAGAIRLLADDARGVAVELARGETNAPCDGDSLARIAAARRMGQATANQALALALRYQLMSKQTNCILVHQRAESDMATEAAELHRVSSMLAAGWGATGMVTAAAPAGMAMAAMCGMDFDAMAAPSMHRMGSVGVADTGFGPFGGSFGCAGFDPTAPGRGRGPESLETMARTVADHLADGGEVSGLAARFALITVHDEALQALDAAVQLGLGMDQALLVLAHWVQTRARGLADEALAALLKPTLAAIDADLLARAVGLFEQRLGGYPNHGWTLSRVQRLQRALGRVGRG